MTSLLRSGYIMHSKSPLIPIYLLLFIVTIFSCSEPVSKEAVSSKKFLPQKHNILLITVDTLRADHLSCYNKKLEIKTENTDSLADTGILFKNANCQSSWTLPSIVSLFTSLYPSVHHAGEPQPTTKQLSKVPQNLKVLPLILKKYSYDTAAFVTNVFLSSAFWFGNHFETFINYSNQIDASEKITKNAIQFLKQKRKNPFFLWLHYLDPHEYHTYLKIEIDQTYNGRFKNEKIDFDKLRIGAYRLDARERKYIYSRYLGNIKYCDEQIGSVLNALRELNLYETTLIIFTSDHGEEFWEHDRLDHGHSAYEEALKVPLIFSLPKVLPQRIKVPQLVELIDVVPTVLDLCGIEPDDTFQGESLTPYFLNPSLTQQRFAFSENMLYTEDKKSIQNEKYKLIYFTVSNKYEFYDLEKDPQEQRNIFFQDDTMVQQLRKKLLGWNEENKEVSKRVLKGEQVMPAIINQETKEALKSLGYIM